MKLSYTDGIINWNFRHLGGNGFLVNNREIIKMNYSDSENPYLTYVGNPVVPIPEKIVEKFQDEVKKNYPEGLPAEIIS